MARNAVVLHLRRKTRVLFSYGWLAVAAAALRVFAVPFAVAGALVAWHEHAVGGLGVAVMWTALVWLPLNAMAVDEARRGRSITSAIAVLLLFAWSIGNALGAPDDGALWIAAGLTGLAWLIWPPTWPALRRLA